MGKLVMDALTYGSFHQEVILKLPFLKNHVTSKSFYDKALYYANNINLSPEGRILDVLAVTQAEIISEYGKALPSVKPTIYYSNIMWEYVYILLFYAHYGEQLWIDTILPKMWKMQKNAFVRDEMKKGEEYIEEYICARKDFDERKRATPVQSEPCPDILQIMQDINSGKIRHWDVDWEFQLKNLLFLCRLMPQKFPDVILIWSIIGQLDDPTIKMDIISKLQKAAPKCFDSPFDAQAFCDDCSCIYRVCVKARAYNLRNDIGITHVWTDERKDLNDLAHIFSDAAVEPEWMVGMVEELKRSESENRHHPLLEIVIKSNRNIGQLSIDNIVDFAKRLYIAEGFRQMILSGQEDYREVPTLEKFDWRLRNKCFDIYIDLRKEQIKELLNQDNTRVEGADDYEALQYMYKAEAVVAKETEFDCLQGSPAYNAMWYPGRKLVSDMINVFIQYLPKRIEKIRKAEIAKQTTAPIIAQNVTIEKNFGQINSIENSDVNLNK